MTKNTKHTNIIFFNIFTFITLFKNSFHFSLYLDSWNPHYLPFYIQNYYLKHNDPEKSVNLHYMVIDPENILSETKPELDSDKIRSIYNTHKINIYVVFINIFSLSQNKLYDKEQKIVLVIIFFEKNDENKIRKEIVMKKKINKNNNNDIIQILNKNIYKLKIKEYNDIINGLTAESKNNGLNNFGWFSENLKLFDIILALWILIVSFLFKYLIKIGKKKTKKKYNNNNLNYVRDYFFINPIPNPPIPKPQSPIPINIINHSFKRLIKKINYYIII